MGDKSMIEWTEATWNPVTGCTKVSPGCKNCYAERMAKRLAGRAGYPADDPFKVTLHEDRIHIPNYWKTPRMIFPCSMSDLFHPDVPDQFIARIFNVMGTVKRHTFQVLTKRPDRMLDFTQIYYDHIEREPFSNVWLGTSVENTIRANKRIPYLKATPAAVRFISCEPLLESINLGIYLNYRIDWVIVGGESGPKARPIDLDWIRSIRNQCSDASVPLFVKQLGTDWAKKNHADYKGSNPKFWPIGLNIREYPRK